MQVPSPCKRDKGSCQLTEAITESTPYCNTCYRTLEEVVLWPQLRPFEKLEVLEKTKERKALWTKT